MSKVKNNENYLRFKRERTLVLIKPDGVARGLIGEILSRFERVGLKIAGLGAVQPTRAFIDKHYPKEKNWIENLGLNLLRNAEDLNIKVDLKKEYGVNNTYELGKLVRSWLLDYVSSGPVVKIALEGLHAIQIVRKLTGKTIPLEAVPGTIRGDFSVDSPATANPEKRSVINLIHASGNEKEAKYELNLWFKKEELVDYNK